MPSYAHSFSPIENHAIGRPEWPGPGSVHLWVRGSPPPSSGRADLETVAFWNSRSQTDLRQVLFHYLGTEPKFLRGAHGKPYLSGGPEFNLSHSAGATAIAISSRPIGVDIESPHRKSDVEGVAHRYFSPEEARDLCSAADPARRFLQFWVRKEAMCKLAGKGIYRGLRFARAGMTGTPQYRNKKVWIKEFGQGFGLVGALAGWESADVKVFVLA